MATEAIYNRLISSTSKGVVDPDKLMFEIHSGSSGISRQCSSIDTGINDADHLQITMKDALPTIPVDEVAALDAIIAAHDGTIPLKTTEAVNVTPQVGGFAVLTDGLEIEVDSDAGICVGAEYPIISDDCHLQGVHAQWTGMKLGDHSILCVIHKGSISALGADVGIGDTQITLPLKFLNAENTIPITAVYDPKNGALEVEFWDNSNPNLPLLKEVHVIESVDLAQFKVNIKGGLKENYVASTTLLKVRFGEYTSLRDDGTGRNLTGGFRMLSSGFLMMRNEVAVTKTIPTSMCLAARIKLKPGKAGLREFVLNYFFREINGDSSEE